MNGYSLLYAACRLIGIEQVDDGLKITGLSHVNSILAELDIPTLFSLNQQICGEEQPLQAAVFGVAMLVAASTGDNEAKHNTEILYRQKRAWVKGKITHIKNSAFGGEDL